MTEAVKRERKPTFDPNYIRDISETVYRMNLNRDCGEGSPERMIADDKDNGEKLRNRAGAYDKLTRTYLKVLGFEPDASTLTSADHNTVRARDAERAGFAPFPAAETADLVSAPLGTLSFAPHNRSTPTGEAS